MNNISDNSTNSGNSSNRGRLPSAEAGAGRRSAATGATARAIARGFTFLEVLVISGVIAGLAVSTYSYMAVTQRGVRMSQATQDVQAIRSAAINWSSGRKDFFKTIEMEKVAYMLPPRLATDNFSNAGKLANPWRGDYSLAAGTGDDTELVITVTAVPNNLGVALQDRLNADETVAAFTAGTGEETVGKLVVTYD